MVQSDTTGGVMQLELFGNEDKPKREELETKPCSGCKRELPNDFEHFMTNVDRNGNYYTKHLCKDCYNEDKRILNKIRNCPTTPPKSECCDNCGIHFSKIKSLDVHLDHCHDTHTFRGWLCKNCNIGLGMLGDNIESIKQALAYLERAAENGPRTRSQSLHERETERETNMS